MLCEIYMCVCLEIIIGHKIIFLVVHCTVLNASFINFNTINSFILWFIWYMEMVKLTGKSGNVTTHSLKHILPTDIIFTVHLERFKMTLMCGLLLLANQVISRHQCNSKRSANNRCHLPNDSRPAAPSRVVSYSRPPSDAWMQLRSFTALNSPI